MDRDHSTSTADDQEADQALRDARSRFVAGFTQRHAAMGSLMAGIADDAETTALSSLRQAAHKMAGLAGVLGFPSVSEHAATLEVALLQSPIDADRAGQALAQMGSGFSKDLAGAAPSWAADAAQPAAGARILIVEDDQEQRRVAAAGLRAAGYRVVTAESGSEGVEVAQAERPDLVLLDVDLPGLDGMSVCRQLKLNPALSSVPVIFCTARTSALDRMAGLTLGADDYISKPFAPGELLIRIRRLIAKPAAAAPRGGFTYELFAPAARELLRRGPAAVVMLHLAPADIDRASAALHDNLRRRDVIGRFSNTHLVLLAPEQSATAAKAAVRAIVEALTPPLANVAIGAAESPAGDATALDGLLAQADLALAADRVARGGDDGKTSVLLAEDDADVMQILDTRMRAAGYRTLLAFDGQQTFDILEKESPAIILLDLMMPRLTGFDVLLRLRERATRPRTVVLSARGRDEDVTRAFELGADDYVTKPFNPDELLARIARLIR